MLSATPSTLFISALGSSLVLLAYTSAFSTSCSARKASSAITTWAAPSLVCALPRPPVSSSPSGAGAHAAAVLVSAPLVECALRVYPPKTSMCTGSSTRRTSGRLLRLTSPWERVHRVMMRTFRITVTGSPPAALRRLPPLLLLGCVVVLRLTMARSATLLGGAPPTQQPGESSRSGALAILAYLARPLFRLL